MANNDSLLDNRKVFLYVLISILVLLVITNCVTLYFFITKRGSQPVFEKKSPMAIDQVSPTADVDSMATPDASESVLNNEVVSDGMTTTENVDVAWYDVSSLKNIGAKGFFGDNYDAVLKKVTSNSKIETAYNKDAIDNSEYFKIGKIISGSYKDKELYLISPMIEMAPTQFFRVIKNGDQYVVLSKYSAELFGLYLSVYTVNDMITIRNLETPNTIGIPNSSVNLIKANAERYLMFQTIESSSLTKLFEYARGQYVYKYHVSEFEVCFLAIASDGTVREYEFDILGGRKLGAEAAQLPIVWSSGASNKYEFYKGSIGGCGVGRCYNYPDSLTANDLVKSGVLSGKYDVFELREGALLSDGVSYLRRMYDDYYPGYDSATDTALEKIPYETFIKEHPVIFWKDPFGGYAEFRNMSFIPAVECGKPVIYLYPEKEMDVTVKVNPNGGFSVTEPAYNGGWLVKATPEGNLFNYADKKYYPYLFWEGKGMFYQRPQQGFVVAKKDVEKFLWDKLALLGLNENESAEFIEFWLPRMQNRNYYFITFVPQSQFDRLAPLSVSPKPDTVIRVFMDYEGLDHPVKVAAQKIATPERNGFTVVEWGGALHQ
ncbi:MAG: hypothetical protein ACOZBH_02445 [Patescibacteria group bacterium]